MLYFCSKKWIDNILWITIGTAIIFLYLIPMCVIPMPMYLINITNVYRRKYDFTEWRRRRFDARPRRCVHVLLQVRVQDPNRQTDDSNDHSNPNQFSYATLFRIQVLEPVQAGCLAVPRIRDCGNEMSFPEIASFPCQWLVKRLITRLVCCPCRWKRQ